MTSIDIQNKLLKYSPTFLKENDILDGLYQAIANTDYLLLSEVLNLINVSWTGKGLRKTADLFGLIYNSDDSDANIQAKVMNAFLTNLARGTEAGILQDLRDYIGDSTLTYTLYEPDNCGAIVDKTYEGVDVQATVDVNKGMTLQYTTSPAIFGMAMFGTAKFGITPLFDVMAHINEMHRKLIPIDITILSVN